MPFRQPNDADPTRSCDDGLRADVACCQTSPSPPQASALRAFQKTQGMPLLVHAANLLGFVSNALSFCLLISGQTIAEQEILRPMRFP